MIKLREEKLMLWGDEKTFCPFLLDHISGDGRSLIWFEYMNDRPRYYIIRVDSAMDFGNGITDDNKEAMDDIMDAIASEAESFMMEEQLDDYFRYGYFTGDREWPIPPFEMADGYMFGPIEDVETIKYVNRITGGGEMNGVLKQRIDKLEAELKTDNTFEISPCAGCWSMENGCGPAVDCETCTVKIGKPSNWTAVGGEKQ